MWSFRQARPGDAAEACAVIRRSIIELCGADHGGNPAILAAWLANKTPEQVRLWINANGPGMVVAAGTDGIAGVGSIRPDGSIALAYVAPGMQRQGIGAGLLRAMEQEAGRAGHTECTLTSTVTAHGFYLAQGYMDAGGPVASFGGKLAYPMRRTIGPAPSV